MNDLRSLEERALKTKWCDVYRLLQKAGSMGNKCFWFTSARWSLQTDTSLVVLEAWMSNVLMSETLWCWSHKTVNQSALSVTLSFSSNFLTLGDISSFFLKLLLLLLWTTEIKARTDRWGVFLDILRWIVLDSAASERLRFLNKPAARSQARLWVRRRSKPQLPPANSSSFTQLHNRRPATLSHSKKHQSE